MVECCAAFSAPVLEATGLAFCRTTAAFAIVAPVAPAGFLSNLPMDAVDLLARTAEACICTYPRTHVHKWLS
jgi:hypothetical protein